MYASMYGCMSTCMHICCMHVDTYACRQTCMNMYVCMYTCVCDRLHRDARWIGGLSHQSSDLSCIHYSLQKVVVHACSNTGFEQHKVVNYPGNLQTP